MDTALRLQRFLLRLAFAGACLAALARGATAAAQEPASSPDLLTIDQAVKTALANNLYLKIVTLDLDSSKDKVAVARTRRYPAFNIYSFGSQLLAPISFQVPAGQFGTYPGIGPIPAINTNITTPSQPTAYIFGTISQPLLTLKKINLHVHGEELSLEQTVQQVREQRNTVVNDVKQAYYSVVEIDNVISATLASIKQYEELDRITQEYVTEKVALQSDSLEVKAKLADQKLQLLQAQDKLQTAKETLNNLLARDLEIDFSVSEDKTLSPTEQDLKAAQATALSKNPTVKEAEIKIDQADNVRRLAKSEYLPDIGASFHYLSPFGVNFVPTNVMAVGIELNWEPFDWGRRRDTVNEKTVAVEQSKLNLTQTKANVLVDVNKEFRALQEARMAVDVAGAQQDATRMKLQEVTDKYGQKTALLRDVLEQQAKVEKANSDYNEAIATFWTAKANFDKAIGED
jgi:outer membrane protein TolC